MTGLDAALSIRFAPLVSPEALAGFALLCTVLLVLSFIASGRRALPLRLLAALGFLAILSGPALVEETRVFPPEVAVVVADRSPSNATPDRRTRTDSLLENLKKTIGEVKGLELRILEAPDSVSAASARKTSLFEPLISMLSDVPETRRAGVIFLTDGQVHDVPLREDAQRAFGPVHTILTGQRNEKDRSIVFTHMPTYGLVGQNVTIRYKVENFGPGLSDTASLTIRRGTLPPESQMVPVGAEMSVTLPVSNVGQNILELETPVPDGDIAPANNHAALIVNGVRDRLRVLLVSGTPHAGERVWRDILTADPGVDLVHFTILRNPDMIDLTPQKEMSLIAFPFQDLFERKLDGFDLIILDRYRQNDIMPDVYFSNIADYVRKGGGLLISSGPEYAGPESLRNSALRDVIPGSPTGQIDETPFRPTITTIGQRHPVTSGLTTGRDAPFGQWMRVLGLENVEGPDRQILMRAGDDSRAAPLLILSHEGKGRVAHLSSDQIWLWARGFDGGGPYADFMRRTIHWLMKEPELEENALDLSAEGLTLVLRRRTLSDPDKESNSVRLTGPDGNVQTIPLVPEGNGQSSARVPVDLPGVWQAETGALRRIVVAGDTDSPEHKDIRSTPDKLASIAVVSGGSIRWAEDDSAPSVRLVPEGRTASGKGWIGLRQNNTPTVTGAKVAPLLPPWISFGILMSLVLMAWIYEGRKKRLSGP